MCAKTRSKKTFSIFYYSRSALLSPLQLQHSHATRCERNPRRVLFCNLPLFFREREVPFPSPSSSSFGLHASLPLPSVHSSSCSRLHFARQHTRTFFSSPFDARLWRLWRMSISLRIFFCWFYFIFPSHNILTNLKSAKYFCYMRNHNRPAWR